ncbi:MAG: DUF948 domain-containing protein [Actinomycetota bacterium]|nr:DUF948 domain-containing protein [Actinomycetota bacterium]
MNWALILDVTIALAVGALSIFLVVVLIQLSRTLRSINALVKDFNREIIPIFSKLQSTVDEVNTELARVDEIVKAVQEASDKVNATAEVARQLISPSLIKLASLSTGVKKAVTTLVRGKGD